MLPPSWVFPTVAASTWLGETLHRPGRKEASIDLLSSYAAGHVGPLDHDR